VVVVVVVTDSACTIELISKPAAAPAQPAPLVIRPTP